MMEISILNILAILDLPGDASVEIKSPHLSAYFALKQDSISTHKISVHLDRHSPNMS